MVEIELKYLITNLDDIIEKILSLGFILSKERIYELSEMFDNKDLLMQKTDGRIRVRKTGDTVEFCYKKPISREGIKKEIEHEVEVSDYNNLISIITEMGFDKTTSYERYRTEYKKDGIKITIDEYPFSSFIEIEGDEEKIKSISDQLNFDFKNNITDSCDTLFTKWRADNELIPTEHMLFNTFNK